ncbi:MAG TPA: GtrA family protein [Candidatus Paceibacterota bacterium]
MYRAIGEKNYIQQFTKFVLVGGLNTFIDFAVLNILILIFGLVQSDPKYIFFKIFSYVTASINSFFFNKFWVFKNKLKENQNIEEKEKTKKEIFLFTITSIVGLVLNTLVAFIVFKVSSIIFPSLSVVILANIGAISGTLVVLIFNFLIYKFIIFK